MNKITTISFKRRKLPHWMVANRPYFVTFRLKGSLPKSVVDKLNSEKDKLNSVNATCEILYKQQQMQFKLIEDILDCNIKHGEDYFLAQAEIANLIINAFEFIETKYCWRFPAFVIMPNHIHCLAVNKDRGIKRNLTETIGYLKSFVGREGNKILQRTGRMWADENFDHWCRSPEKVEGVVKYIKNNPVKARLVKKSEDWQWLKIKR